MNTETLRTALACLGEARQAIDDPERLPATVLNRAMLHQIEYGEGAGLDQFITARVEQAEALLREALHDLEARDEAADAAYADLVVELEAVDQLGDFTDPTLKRVAEVFLGLDRHVRRGGTPPAAWRCRGVAVSS